MLRKIQWDWYRIKVYDIYHDYFMYGFLCLTSLLRAICLISLAAFLSLTFTQAKIWPAKQNVYISLWRFSLQLFTKESFCWACCVFSALPSQPSGTLCQTCFHHNAAMQSESVAANANTSDANLFERPQLVDKTDTCSIYVTPPCPLLKNLCKPKEPMCEIWWSVSLISILTCLLLQQATGWLDNMIDNNYVQSRGLRQKRGYTPAVRSIIILELIFYNQKVQHLHLWPFVLLYS